MASPRKQPFCVERFNRFASLGIMIWSATMLTFMSMGWVSSKSEMFFVTVLGGSSAVFGVNAVNRANQSNSTSSANRPTIKRKTPPQP
jgi:DNA-binding transcriptional regulator LsrR (DeoR family)